ncbi:HvfB family MNIO-type RiPP peptide maturase [Lysobacter tyrosinilyticus]
MPLSPNSTGLGLRRSLLEPLRSAAPGDFDFLECAPENWIGVGGRYGDALRELSARHPLVCHGLSLSLGGFAPLDRAFLERVRRFLDHHNVTLYSEHLSYCADDGQLYDLLPIPFTEEAVHHVAARIRQAQDIVGRRIAVENVSYYAAPHQAMREIDFINAVLSEADCDLLLDVNNIYVNAVNHRYDAHEFLSQLPGDRVAYIHVAGHYDEAEDLKVDTHGAPVKDAVWRLLGAAYARFGARTTLLERDFNIPPYAELVAELDTIRSVMREHAIADAFAPARHVHA